MAVSLCGKRILLTRSCLFTSTTRKTSDGFIVLLPEIGEDLPEKDPLLKENGLPEFNTFTIERSIAAIGKQTVEFEQSVKNVEDRIEGDKKIDVAKDIFLPLEEAYTPLHTTWGIAKTLFYGNESLMPTTYYTSVQNRMLIARGAQFTSVPIYKACVAALESKDNKYTITENRMISKFILEGRLNGLDLSELSRKKYKYFRDKLSLKQEEVRLKVKVATNMFKHKITNPNIVQDFPEEYLRVIAEDPANPYDGPWKINLKPHIAVPFMELCPSRELRWNVWQANLTRCYQADENHLRTSTAIEGVRDCRNKLAGFLNYKSFSHMSMETKMAGDLENVYDFLDTLLETARPVQEKEIADLTVFACKRGFEDKVIQEWDIDYWIRKHRRSVLNLKEEILRDYFPLPHVLNTLLQLIETLFDVRIVETRKTDVWHVDVRFFDVIDLKGSSDEPIASFYFDPYSKGDMGLRLMREFGWFVPIRNLGVHTSTKPLAALIFNFQRPTKYTPSLLSFNDVVVLFEKFGHALQHLLTKVDYTEVAGTDNIEWDATEVSDNFLANWLYEPSIIRQISSNYKTSEPLPDDLIENLKNLRFHMAGFKLCKEIYLSRFDLELHEKVKEFWVQMQERLWKKHLVIPQDYLNNHVLTWESIFIGEKGAAYYSSLWSRMVAADVYSAFEEIPAGNKELIKETASRYRETFLSLGGSVPASEVFRRFRGRDPNPDALLKHLGLRKNQIESGQ